MDRERDQLAPHGIQFHIQRRPALLWTALLAGGIGLRDVVPPRPWLWLAIGTGLLLLAMLLRRRESIVGLAIALGTVLVGLAAAQVEHYQFPPDHIWAYTSDGERFGQVEAVIDQAPRLLLPGPAELRSLPPKQVTQATVRRISTKSGWAPAGGELLLSIEQPNPRLAVGQTVRLTGLIQRPPKPMNPGEFDWYSYCRDQRILVTMRISHADGVQIINDPGPGPLMWLREKTRHLLAMGFAADQTSDHAMLQTFVLGDPDPQLRQVQEQFVRTGTVHLLSISGLHVAIIGGLVLLVCRLFRRSPRFSVCAALLVIAIYASVAIPSWPGWRSVIMCAAATMGLLGRRSIDALQMLAVAVAVVLLIHPADLRNGGFQVSLAAVLGLILFSGPVMHRLSDWWRGPDAAAAGPPKGGQIATAWRAAGGIVAGLLVASTIAWLMSMPLIAYHFGQLNAWSVPAGVALLPLTIVALTGGLMKIFLTLCWPTMAHVWAVAAAAPIALMRNAVGGLGKLPGASILIPAPSIALLVAYYLLLCGVLVRRRRPWMRWLTPLAPAMACAGFALWPAAMPAAAPAASPTQVRITLLSVGAGQCAVVLLPSHHVVMIDAGSATVSDVSQRLVMPYLGDEGLGIIDKIILSHGDFGHISAAADLFRGYHQPQVMMSPHFQRQAFGNYPAQDLLATLMAAGCSPAIAHRGDRLDLGGGVSINVLWPPADCDMNSNNCSLVLKLNFGGRSVLFPGDIQEPAQRALLKNPSGLKCDVLVAPHQGSAESTTAEFIRAADPRTIVASSDRKLTHKQKDFDVLATGYPLYRTSRCGAIALTIDDQGHISVQTYLGAAPQLSPSGSSAAVPTSAAEILP